MKYVYALMLIIVSSIFFFWTYVFIVPPPRLYLSDNVYEEINLDTSSTISKRILEISKIENKERFYYFDPAVRTSKFKPIFFYTLITAALFVLFIIVLHARNFIGFSLLFSILIAYIMSISLWIFSSSIHKNIYLDIHAIRDVYYNIKAAQFLGLFVFLQLLLVLLGLWKFDPKTTKLKN